MISSHGRHARDPSSSSPPPPSFDQKNREGIFNLPSKIAGDYVRTAITIRASRVEGYTSRARIAPILSDYVSRRRDYPTSAKSTDIDFVHAGGYTRNSARKRDVDLSLITTGVVTRARAREGIVKRRDVFTESLPRRFTRRDRKSARRFLRTILSTTRDARA